MNGCDESPPPPPPPADSPAFHSGAHQSRRNNARVGGGSSSVKDRMSKLDMMTKVVFKLTTRLDSDFYFYII